MAILDNGPPRYDDGISRTRTFGRKAVGELGLNLLTAMGFGRIFISVTVGHDFATPAPQRVAEPGGPS